MKLAFVTAYPPSTAPLSEYGWHLVNGLKESSRITRVHVLCNRAPGATDVNDGKVSVRRCWSYGGMDLPAVVLREAKTLNVDAIWFNMHLTFSGRSRLSRFSGMLAPAAARSRGTATLVTLHNMLGLTDLSQTSLNAGRLDLLGARLATLTLRYADAVCVPRPEYVELLTRRYGLRRVYHVPLGTLGVPIGEPTGGREGIVAFGHFGSNKRIEHLIEAVAALRDKGRTIQLLVGGASSRHNPQYLERVRRAYGHADWVTFLGYVAEADVPALFQRAIISVLPYGTVTGMSSVALQSAMHGTAIVASDIPGLRVLDREGLRMSFYDWDDTTSLMRALDRVLDSSEAERQDNARLNLEYCRRQPMASVVDRYLDILESRR